MWRRNWDSVVCIRVPVSQIPTSIKHLFILFILIGLAPWYLSSNVSSPCYSRVQRFLESPESTHKTSRKIFLQGEFIFSVRKIDAGATTRTVCSTEFLKLTNKQVPLDLRVFTFGKWHWFYLCFVWKRNIFEIRIYNAIRVIFFQSEKNFKA